jgi:heme/copper-type cytochrome/quinol oxidase subunit 2
MSTSKKSSTFSEKVAELQGQINSASGKAASKEKCIPTMLIAGIIAPILVWLVLYFLQPSFVQKKDGNKYVRDNTLVFYWTVFVTVIIWVSMYLFTYCQGYDSAAMLCSRK